MSEREQMNAHIRDKQNPARDASETEKWCSSVDMMAASRLYHVNILVHERSNALHKKPSWRVFNPYASHSLFLSTQESHIPTILIDFVNKNHYQIVLSVLPTSLPAPRKQ